MNTTEIEALRIREIAMLDQLEASLLEWLGKATTDCEARAIRKRLRRLHRLQVIWGCSTKGVNSHGS